MQKRGQIAVFVIVALLLIGAITLVRLSFLQKEVVPAEIRPLNDFVQGCVDSLSKEALFIVGQKGGYFQSAKLETNEGITYFIHSNKSVMPSKEIVERELGSYVEEFLPLCLEDFAAFPDYEVNFSSLSKTSALIMQNEISFSMEWPLTVSKGESKYILGEWETKVPVRLGEIYDTSQGIVEESLKVRAIPLSYVVDTSIEKNLQIDFQEYANNTIFVITDENSKIAGQSYIFKFAIRS